MIFDEQVVEMIKEKRMETSRKKSTELDVKVEYDRKTLQKQKNNLTLINLRDCLIMDNIWR